MVALTACSGGSTDGRLEVHGDPEHHCYGESGPIDIIVGVTRLTNTGDDALTVSGVTLVGDSTVSLTESAILPYEYESGGRAWYLIGAGYYPGTSFGPKWDEARTSVPGAIIRPGETVDFAYRATLPVPSVIDHAELAFTDESGDEHVARDTVSVTVVHEGTACSAPDERYWPHDHGVGAAVVSSR